MSWRFSRSSGPGGQGVNTADSRAELVWDLTGSGVLSPLQRERLLERLSARVVAGVLTITASEHRSQLLNRNAATAMALVEGGSLLSVDGDTMAACPMKSRRGAGGPVGDLIRHRARLRGLVRRALGRPPRDLAQDRQDRRRTDRHLPRGARRRALPRLDRRAETGIRRGPLVAALHPARAAEQAFFETLSGANRYAILYRVNDAKQAETRAARIAKFVDMCRNHENIH